MSDVKLSKAEGKMKECPFCNGEAHVFPSKYADITLWNTRCMNCYAAHDGYKKGSDAIAAWNRRAPDPAAQAVVEALEEAMKCDTCDGSGKLFYPPSCNCYGDPVCTHKEFECECCACDGSGLRDIPVARAALATWHEAHAKGEVKA